MHIGCHPNLQRVRLSATGAFNVRLVIRLMHWMTGIDSRGFFYNETASPGTMGLIYVRARLKAEAKASENDRAKKRRPLVWKLFIPAFFPSVFNLTNYALASSQSARNLRSDELAATFCRRSSSIVRTAKKLRLTARATVVSGRISIRTDMTD